jgi:hypothetical protein
LLHVDNRAQPGTDRLPPSHSASSVASAPPMRHRIRRLDSRESQTAKLQASEPSPVKAFNIKVAMTGKSDSRSSSYPFFTDD